MFAAHPSTDLNTLAFLVATVLLMGTVFAWRRYKGQGLKYGYEPDRTAWRDSARLIGLSFLPLPQGASLSGVHEGVNVIVEAKWHRASRRQWFGPQMWAVSTEIRGAFGATMPDGLHLRGQNVFLALTDVLVNGDEITLGDAKFDAAFLIHGKDVQAVDRVLPPPARLGLLGLSQQGALVVDQSSIRLTLPSYVTDPTRLQNLLSLVTGVVHEMRGTAAGQTSPEGLPLPVAMTPYYPTLSSLVRRAVAQGGAGTAMGRRAMLDIAGQLCTVEIDVERSEPSFNETGREVGVSLSGLLVGGTSRVDLVVAGPAMNGFDVPERGMRIRATGVVDNFDGMRDHAVVHAEKTPERVVIPAERPSTVSVMRTAGDERVDEALTSEQLSDVLAALAIGRDARNRLLQKIRGRTYTLTGTIADAAKTPAWRATERLRDGLTTQIDVGSHRVAVRFPPDRNPWLHELQLGDAIEVQARLMEWEEVAQQPVFEEVD